MTAGTGRMCIVVLIFVTGLTSFIDGSAIPMWEFLSKSEKISRLYRLYSKEVASYCLDSSMPDCNKNLLISGHQRLSNMDENTLDELDPYQRNARYKIWRTLVGENNFNSRAGHDSTGSNEAADTFATSESDRNDLAEESAIINDYTKPIDHGPYLVGPMVIRVLPDGRPVPGDDQRPLPQDEDLDDLSYSRVPSLSEIQTNNDRFPLKKSYDSSSNVNLIGYHPRFIRFLRPIGNYYGTSLFHDHHKPNFYSNYRYY